MVTTDDPFGLGSSSRRRAAPENGEALSADLPLGTQGQGPLVQAGFSLLMLAPLLRVRNPPSDLVTLRYAVERELSRFSNSLLGRGTDERLVQLGNYSLCALLDDAVLNTPWGKNSPWQDNSLAGELHRDLNAGENFFTYLEQARRAPDLERVRMVLELMSVCLALGFQGRYRLVSGGDETIRRIRVGVAGDLSRLDRDPIPDLSGHWQGIPAPHGRVTSGIPLWVWGSALLAFLLLTYGVLQLGLGIPAARLDALIEAMPPAGHVEIIRSASETVSPSPVAKSVSPAVFACLGGPSAVGPDAVMEDDNQIRIRLPDTGLFASGHADLNATIIPTLQCIRDVAAGMSGRVLIIGHTDNVPIHTAAFPDNWALSRARADVVAEIFRPVLKEPRQLTVLGRAGTEPIDMKTDITSRARNRRVEIVLQK
jgi:type VI secretion system protein ImpK